MEWIIKETVHIHQKELDFLISENREAVNENYHITEMSNIEATRAIWKQ